MKHPISRRTFFKTSVLAGATAACGGLSPGSGLTEFQATASPTSVDRPMRWAQLTLVEDDPGKFDPDFWLDYFHRTHSDAVCLSAGGCVAYYPTKIPLHHRSAWLGNSDPFGELVAGCRKLNMVVIARTDPHATYDDVHEVHPDWIAIDAEGRPRRHWASPEMWVTCGLGPYNFQFMTEVKKEIMAHYMVDGIFINRWDGSGICYCIHCRQNFQEAAGHALPRTTDPQNPARRAYILWRQQRLFELWRLWDAEVRKINLNSCVIPNTGGGAGSSLDMKQIGEFAETLMADRQARRGLTAPWANGKTGKEFRSTMARKPIVGIFSVGLEEPERWKDSVQNAAEIQVWVAEGIANGLRPWFTKFSGSIHDPRWLKVVEDIYQWHKRAEKYLRNEVPIARVALVYSQQTAWFYVNDRLRLEDHSLGWYQALIEARVPFEMVHDRLLDAEHTARFKTLILPNIAALSNQQCEQLKAFVRAGGSIIATFESSLYDEWGVKRADFGLADLFGCSFKGQVEGPMQNSYLRLEHELAPGHQLLKGLEDAPRIINGVWRLEVEARDNSGKGPLTLIPSYPDLPMEKVYPRVLKTDKAQLFLRELAGGRVAYFPWDIDRTFWEVLAVDHGKLMRNALAWTMNEDPVVQVIGPGLIDVTVWLQNRSLTVHLVNLTNPMTMKGPFRELITIGEQQVRVRLPQGRRPKDVHLLSSGFTPKWEVESGWLRTTVSSVLLHEVVAIDLE